MEIISAIANHAWWGALGLLAVLKIHDGLVHIGNGLIALARAELEKTKK